MNIFNPNQYFLKIFKLLFFIGVLIHSHTLIAGGFYLQELGTPSSIGTAGTARTTNHVGAETAWGNPAGMTGLEKTTMLNGAQVIIPTNEFDSDIAEAGGSDGGNAGNIAAIPSFFFVKPVPGELVVKRSKDQILEEN